MTGKKDPGETGFEAERREMEQFLSLALHDLRSPLNSATLLAQLLHKQFAHDLPQEGRFITEKLSSQLEVMGALVSSMSEYLSASREDVPTAVCLDAVVDNARMELGDICTQMAGEIAVEPLPTVLGREAALVRVFKHVIRNSILYGGSGPLRISITSQKDGTFCKIRLQDNGPGFDSEFAEQIFEPFKRLHTEAVPGSGLGLATCRRILERFGGHIWAESEPGKGASFYLTLPLAAV